MSILLFFFKEGGGQIGVGFLFWILIILTLIFGFFTRSSIGEPLRNFYYGGGLLLLVLLILLGYGTFGWPFSGQ